jgi:hypothetical protein
LFFVFSSTGGGIGALLGGIFMQGEIDIEILQKWSNDFYPGKIFLEKIAKLIISSYDQENIYVEGNPGPNPQYSFRILSTYVCFNKAFTANEANER